MNILILIIVAVGGIVLGMYFARGMSGNGGSGQGGLIGKQAREKVESKVI